MSLTIKSIQKAIAFSKNYNEKQLKKLTKNKLIELFLWNQEDLNKYYRLFEEEKTEFEIFENRLSKMKSYEFTKLRKKLSDKYNYDE